MTQDDGTRYVRSELEKMDGKVIPLKNPQGDIIGTAKLQFVDDKLVGHGVDKITGIGFEATLIPADKVVDE